MIAIEKQRLAKGKYDLTGQRFGRWLVIERNGTHRSGQRQWRCLCDCGSGKDAILSNSLTKGVSQSCGCLRSELVSDRMKASHGVARKENLHLYGTWLSMKTRCYNSVHPSYRNYGARGVKVCDAWLNSFSQFVVGVGEKPSKTHSLDRINNDGNYEPGNVRWATRIQQSSNRRTKRPVIWQGVERKLVDVCLEQNVDYISVYQRLNKSRDTLEQAVYRIRSRGLAYRERAKDTRP